MKRKSDDLHGTNPNFGHHDLYTIMETILMIHEMGKQKQKDKPQ